MPTKPTRVYAIPGRFTNLYPLEDQELPSRKDADAAVATGAFALTQKEANAQAFRTPDATPATDANVKQPRAEAPAPAAPAEAPAAPAAGDENDSGEQPESAGGEPAATAEE